MKTSFEFVKASLFRHGSCWAWYGVLLLIGCASGFGALRSGLAIHMIEAIIFLELVLATIAFVASERVIDICLTWSFRLATLAFVLCVLA